MKLLHAYIDAQSQRLIEKYLGDGVQGIAIFSIPMCKHDIFLQEQVQYTVSESGAKRRVVRNQLYQDISRC